MPKLSQKKVITLKSTISKTFSENIEVNPSIRLSAIQHLLDDMAVGMREAYPDFTVEVTAEGLI